MSLVLVGKPSFSWQSILQTAVMQKLAVEVELLPQQLLGSHLHGVARGTVQNMEL